MIVHKEFDKNCNVIEEMCRVLKEIFVNGLAEPLLQISSETK